MAASSVDREYNNVVREKPSIEECRGLGNIVRGKPYCQRSLQRYRGNEISPLDVGPCTAEIVDSNHEYIRNSQKANSSLADGDDKVEEKRINFLSAKDSSDSKEMLRWKAEADKLRHENIALKEEALRVRTDHDTPQHLNASNLSIALPSARSESKSSVLKIGELHDMRNKNRAEEIGRASCRERV